MSAAFLFPGQGSQVPGMLHAIRRREPFPESAPIKANQSDSAER